METVRALSGKLMPGFILFTDSIHLEKMDLECAPVLGEIMEECAKMGLGAVVPCDGNGCCFLLYRFDVSLMIELDRLDHLVLTVVNLEATCVFYIKVLGMTAVSFDGRKASSSAIRRSIFIRLGTNLSQRLRDRHQARPISALSARQNSKTLLHTFARRASQSRKGL